jgi:hypothetical protein
MPTAPPYTGVDRLANIARTRGNIPSEHEFDVAHPDTHTRRPLANASAAERNRSMVDSS